MQRSLHPPVLLNTPLFQASTGGCDEPPAAARQKPPAQRRLHDQLMSGRVEPASERHGDVHSVRSVRTCPRPTRPVSGVAHALAATQCRSAAAAAVVAVAAPAPVGALAASAALCAGGAFSEAETPPSEPEWLGVRHGGNATRSM